MRTSTKFYNDFFEQEMTQEILDRVETMFKELSSSLDAKLGGNLEQKKMCLSPTEFLRQFKTVYDLPLQGFVGFQEGLLLDFLEKQSVENASQIIILTKCFHLLADWLHLMFYHQNVYYQNGFSSESLLKPVMLGSFFNNHFYAIRKTILDIWKDILYGTGSTSEFILVLDILKNHNSQYIIDRFLPELQDLVVQSFKIQSEYSFMEEVVEFIERIDSVLKLPCFLNTLFYEGFMEKFRWHWILPRDLGLRDKWIRAIEKRQKTRWYVVYKFVGITGKNNDRWWKDHSTHFSKKWRFSSLEEILSDVNFQKYCISQIETEKLNWHSILDNDLACLFRTRTELYSHLVLEIDRGLRNHQEGIIEKWKVLLEYCQDRELFCRLYQEKLRERLIGFDADPDLDGEANQLNQLEVFCGRSFLLNLRLMVTDTRKADKGHDIKVFVISRVGWGIDSNPFRHVETPSYLDGNIQLNSIRIEHLYHLGDVVLTAEYKGERSQIQMYPIQAIALLSLQRENKKIVGIEEVYEGLERDGLLFKREEEWKIRPQLPSVQKCSKWIWKQDTTIKKETSCGFVLEDFHIDAMITRHLKKHRTVHHGSLMQVLGFRFPEVIGTTRFKNRIHELMEREYIRRAESDPSVYEFIP